MILMKAELLSLLKSLKNNDCIFHRHVQSKMVDTLVANGLNVIKGDIIWNACSLHVYERHFKYLSD